MPFEERSGFGALDAGLLGGVGQPYFEGSHWF